VAALETNKKTAGHPAQAGRRQVSEKQKNENPLRSLRSRAKRAVSKKRRRKWEIGSEKLKAQS